MSLLLPADVSQSLPSLTDPQRQTLIDRAEAEIAARIGRSTRQVTPIAVVVPPNESAVESGGVIDQADPPGGTSPLGQADETLDLAEPVESTILLFTSGPVISISSAKIGTTVLRIQDFIVAPWFWKWRDPRQRFVAGTLYSLKVKTGWLRTELPEQMRRAIELQILLLAKKTEAAGTIAQRDVVAEGLDDYSVRFQPDTNSVGGASEQSPDQRISSLIAPWRNVEVI